MARPLRPLPPPPLFGLAISGGTFFCGFPKEVGGKIMFQPKFSLGVYTLYIQNG